MEDLFDTLTLPYRTEFQPASVAVERRFRFPWESVCLVLGIACLLGSGAFFLTLGFTGLKP